MVNRRALFLLILGVTGTGIMGNTLLAPAVPNILDEFGVSDSGAGLLIAATSFPGIFMAPVISVQVAFILFLVHHNMKPLCQLLWIK